MSYVNLIQTNVNLAFRLLKDLAETVVISKKSNQSFDFSTGVASSKSSSIEAQAIIVDVAKDSEERNTVTKQLIINAKESGDLSLYDTFTFGGYEWKLGSPISSDKFITTITVFREF